LNIQIPMVSILRMGKFKTPDKTYNTLMLSNTRKIEITILRIELHNGGNSKGDTVRSVLKKVVESMLLFREKTSVEGVKIHTRYAYYIQKNVQPAPQSK